MQPSHDIASNQAIAEARTKADAYEWMAASDILQGPLRATDSSSSEEKARLLEISARYRFMAAFQSESRLEFEDRMQQSRSSYLGAAAIYEKNGSDAFSKRTTARALFINFWAAKDLDERRKAVEQCIKLALDAARLFEAHPTQVAETFNDLLSYFKEALDLSKNWSELHSLFRQAVKIGRETAKLFQALGQNEGLLEALHKTIWLQAVQAQSALEPSEFQGLADQTRRLGEEMTELSRSMGTHLASCLTNEGKGDIAFNVDGNYAETVRLYELATDSAKEIRDTLVLGRLFWRLAAVTYWRSPSYEYSEERRRALQRGIEYSTLAIKSLETPFYTAYLSAAHATYADCFIKLAIEVETDLQKRGTSLRKAIEIASKGTTYETGTWAWQASALALVKAMYFLSMIEDATEEKTRLLREALPVAERTVRVTDDLFPYFWNRGVVRNYLALVKAELAKLHGDSALRAELAQGAASDMQQCLEVCRNWATVPGLMQRFALYSERYGDILLQIYELTLNDDQAKQAIGAYREAALFLGKSGIGLSQGPLSWKVSKVYDTLGDFAESAESFRKAAENYREAAKKPGLEPAFSELATYMEAWAGIEEARLCHAEEKYDLSHRKYKKVAELLETAKIWRGLAMLCGARSLLERGEALSHEENHSAAVESFSTALDRFRHARKELEKMRTTAVDVWERNEINSWIRIAEHREAYVNGRVELEEARSLDKSGEKIASSRRYDSASQAFNALSVQTIAAQDRSEVEALAQLCKSWARRKEAESRSSPELFAEAADSFMKARESATNQSLRLLALGDASICRALEFGTRFRQSRDIRLYIDVKRHLEIAADHYTEAGFKKAGNWTRATQRLFDALLHLADAEVERNVKKKTELYHLAEKDFSLAARLYGQAGFTSRKREALEQLERAREGKEVYLVPLETLEEIPPASAIHLPPIPLRGAQPLGLERFEDAKVTGELRTPQTHLTMGSDFTVNMDIANVGKTPATLIKLEGIVPEGCEPVEKQNTPNLEGNSLDMKGKRLEYLKTHGVQVSFRPTRKGEFELSPRVVYVDEKGKYKSTNLQPLYLTVREPGISEGLHAPPTVHLPQDFQFESERSRQVFSRLVKKFLDDYMTKRIVMEKAGWRSLMDLIRDVKIPRSTLYGPGGRTGPVLAELERRGLVETRVFPKERGRGGEIKKVRVAYENTIVRRIVDRAVMENA